MAKKNKELLPGRLHIIITHPEVVKGTVESIENGLMVFSAKRKGSSKHNLRPIALSSIASIRIKKETGITKLSNLVGKEVELSLKAMLQEKENIKGELNFHIGEGFVSVENDKVTVIAALDSSESLADDKDKKKKKKDKKEKKEKKNKKGKKLSLEEIENLKGGKLKKAAKDAGVKCKGKDADEIREALAEALGY